MEDGDSALRRALSDATKECLEAIAFVTKSLRIEGVDFGQYKLIAIENLMADSGPNVWRLTFKLRQLIPQTPQSIIGAGGEISVRADMDLKTVTLLGYGE